MSSTRDSTPRFGGRRNAEAIFAPIPDLGIAIPNCRHCYNDSGAAPVQELPLAGILPLLDELREFGQQRLQISGGEPTCHPDFAAIVQEAGQRGMRVSINTNGVIGKQVRESLAKLRFARIAVSLDGMRANNDRVRGDGTFDAALESLPLIKSIADDVSLAVHIFRSNLEDVTGLMALAAREEIGIKFSTLRPIGRARDNMLDEVPTAHEFMQAVKAVNRARRQYPGIRLKTDFDILPMPRTAPATVPPEKAACPAGRSRLNVCFDGWVYPCSFLFTPDRRFAVGRLGERPIIEMWQQAPVLQLLRRPDKIASCRNCPAYGRSCVGGCRAMAYFTTGQLDGRDPVCFADEL